MALVFHDGAWDRVYYGLSVAVAALASGHEVHALFTFGALKRLVTGHSDDLGPETTEAVSDLVRRGPVRGKMPLIAELLADAYRLGLKTYACPAAMAFYGIKREVLLDGVDSIMGLTGFLEIAGGADLSFYI